jgi:hypothetical protein
VGQRWKLEVEKALGRAKVAILLVSPHFLNSDFIHEKELPKLLAAAESEGLTVFWIPVSAALYKETPIGEFQAACDPSRPLDTLGAAEIGKKLVRIAEKDKRGIVESTKPGLALRRAAAERTDRAIRPSFESQTC